MKRGYHHGNLRQALVEAALALIAEKGPQGFTLSEAAKQRLRRLAGRRLTDNDEILLIARTHRTQEGNRREALDRLAALIETARPDPVPRRATRPTRASKERRLATKVRAGQHKRLRGRVRGDD